jgi:hypothetical protein
MRSGSKSSEIEIQLKACHCTHTHLKTVQHPGISPRIRIHCTVLVVELKRRDQPIRCTNRSDHGLDGQVEAHRHITRPPCLHTHTHTHKKKTLLEPGTVLECHRYCLISGDGSANERSMDGDGDGDGDGLASVSLSMCFLTRQCHGSSRCDGDGGRVHRA